MVIWESELRPFFTECGGVLRKISFDFTLEYGK